MSTEITTAAQRYVDAVNAFDTDAIMACFTADALVFDNQREFADLGAIRNWVATELVGDNVTMEITEIAQRSGVTVLRARYDGTYDKTGLPDELILTNYLVTRGDLISALFIVFPTPGV